MGDEADLGSTCITVACQRLAQLDVEQRGYMSKVIVHRVVRKIEQVECHFLEARKALGIGVARLAHRLEHEEDVAGAVCHTESNESRASGLVRRPPPAEQPLKARECIWDIGGVDESSQVCLEGGDVDETVARGHASR
eukprot:scaffold287224_cov27-Tisochrysis_lutea.AAC.4